MKKIFSKDWFKAAGIRALKTFAQTMIGMITVGAALADIDWVKILSVSAVATILSILTSIAGLPEIDYDGEMLVDVTGEKDLYRIDIDNIDNLSDKNRIVLKVDSSANLEQVEDDTNAKD